MSDLPHGWTWATIEDCASSEPGAFTDGPYGSNLKTSHYTSTGPRVIRLGNITPGTLDMSDEAHVAEGHFSSLAKHHVQPGDVVIAALGDPIGRACRVPDDIGPAMVKADCFRLRPGDHVDADYLVNWFNCVDAREVFLASSHGMGRIRVNLSDVRAAPFPLAPLPEQRRIVAKLDRLSARSRAARDHLARTAKLAARAKQAILATALTNFSEFGPLGDLARDIRYGTARKCDYEGGPTPVLRIPNVAAGRIDSADLKRASFEPREVRTLALEVGDLLIIRSNGSVDLVGRSAVVGEEHAGYLYAGYLIRVRLDLDRALPEFVQLVLSSSRTRRLVEGLAKSTSGVNNINSKQLAGILIPRATVPEQRELVRHVGAAFARIDRLTAEAARAANLLDRLDERLLAKAFRGELVSQDPADEPAEALLARIRAVGAEAPRPRRGRRARAT